MKNIYRDFISCFFIGILLYALCILHSFIPLFSLTDKAFSFFSCLTLLLGVLISHLSITYRKPTIGTALFRVVVLFSFFVIAFVVGGSSGFVRFLHGLHDIQSNYIAEDNISGMLVLTFFFIQLITYLISLFIVAISNRINK